MCWRRRRAGWWAEGSGDTTEGAAPQRINGWRLPSLRQPPPPRRSQLPAAAAAPAEGATPAKERPAQREAPAPQRINGWRPPSSRQPPPPRRSRLAAAAAPAEGAMPAKERRNGGRSAATDQWMETAVTPPTTAAAETGPHKAAAAPVKEPVSAGKGCGRQIGCSQQDLGKGHDCAPQDNRGRQTCHNQQGGPRRQEGGACSSAGEPTARRGKAVVVDAAQLSLLSFSSRQRQAQPASKRGPASRPRRLRQRSRLTQDQTRAQPEEERSEAGFACSILRPDYSALRLSSRVGPLPQRQLDDDACPTTGL